VSKCGLKGGIGQNAYLVPTSELKRTRCDRAHYSRAQQIKIERASIERAKPVFECNCARAQNMLLSTLHVSLLP
jgi:hypothetical protein